MAFIRQKRGCIRGRQNFSYLVENRREGGKVRQRVLAYLGTDVKTVGEALAQAEAKMEWLQISLDYLRHKCQESGCDPTPRDILEYDQRRRAFEKTMARIELLKKLDAAPPAD